MYLNTKQSQLSNDVSKMIQQEQTITAPILKSIVKEDVKSEIRAMSNKSKVQQNKIKQAQATLD